jgi:hypothetical protein
VDAVETESPQGFGRLSGLAAADSIGQASDLKAATHAVWMHGHALRYAHSSAMPGVSPSLAGGSRSRSGAGGHVGGEDVVGVAVEVGAGTLWRSQLSELSECLAGGCVRRLTSAV